MKHCPECNSFFPDTELFCEIDGAQLVTMAPQSKASLSLLPIGVLAGILLGGLLVLIYFAMTRQTAPENSNTYSSSAPQQESLRPQQPRPPATENSSPEPSVDPSASPSIETSPSPSATLELSSSNPISTAPSANGRGEPVIIRLNSGLTIEAEEAWQTGEGIWYRKSGVVSLIDPKNVKAIEKVSPAQPQPSAPTATPSP